jgi:hypothetical protein
LHISEIFRKLKIIILAFHITLSYEAYYLGPEGGRYGRPPQAVKLGIWAQEILE